MSMYIEIKKRLIEIKDYLSSTKALLKIIN